MTGNRLKLNPAKTELMLFGTKSSLAKCFNHSIRLSGSMIFREEKAKYLGVTLDSSLTFRAQVTNVCAKAMLNLSRNCCLHQYLNKETCQILVQALVIAHLDYANICYIGLPKKDMERLQRVQNQAAKLVLKAGCLDSTTECLKELHWLPCKYRVQYKVLMTVHQCLQGKGPTYLASLFHVSSVHSQCLAVGDRLLVVPFTKHKTFADRAISVYGPKLRNSALTPTLRMQQNTDVFKRQLKTVLFTHAFG